jgi:hypothetical protein
VPLALVAHVPPGPDRLHIWVGVTGVSGPPALAWKLDHVAVAPSAVRPLTRIRTRPTPTIVYSGLFEFSGLAPNTCYPVELTVGGERVEREFWTLPQEIPFGPQDQFNVLLLSCFHQAEDATGRAGRVLSRIGVRPHLTLFAGDQVYLDLPTLQNFRNDEDWLFDKFQSDYLMNWFGDRQNRPAAEIPEGYPRVLTLAPAAFMPDDHEYWNNYPFGAIAVQNTWGSAGRANWKRAAEDAYRGFQLGSVPFGAANRIDVAPLSILMLDTRSRRPSSSRSQPGDLLGAAGRNSLQTWVADMIAKRPRWFPVLVTGQSFFRSAAGTVTGTIEDFELPDYESDYAFMVQQVEQLSDAGVPVLLATGDVHWGRLAKATDRAGRSASIYEAISSPTSVVRTVFADEVKDVWGFIKGLVGASNAWPHHSDPENPPPTFGSNGHFNVDVWETTGNEPAAMRGNQAWMLRFARAGGGLDVDVICYPLSDEIAFDNAHQWTAQLKLRPGV